MTPEEFFMYLIFALVIVTPIAARVYRRLTLNRTTQMLREQMNRSQPGQSATPPPEPPR